MEAVPVDVALGSFRVDVLTVGKVETAVIVPGVIGAVGSGSSVVSCQFQMAFLPPSGGVFRLSFSGSSPGIPYRRSCGFQGPTGKTAIKKPSQNRPALPSLFLEGHASRLCNG